VSTSTLEISPLHLQANRYALVSRLADDLAHEVKNPLHAMVINLELVRRRIGTGAAEVALERVAIVERETRRVHDLIEAILQLLRPGKAASQAVELDLVVGELLPLVELRARLAHVVFEHEPAGDGTLITVTGAALKQILLNLVEEALAVRPPGSGWMRLTAARAGRHVELHFGYAVADGDPAPVPVADGVPVGIAVARALAEAIGGGTREDAEPGAGRRVCVVTLPLAAGA
jgi:two-component system, NtrC family, C4-dicarboxylate transport sensor histidine kinase DctB